MQLQIFIGVFLGSLLVQVIEACSCGPAHPQEMYCRADYVVRAKIVSKDWYPIQQSTTEAPSTTERTDVEVAPWLEEPLAAAWKSYPYIYTKLVYTVYVEKIYKGGEFLTPKQLVKITSSPDEAMCGATGLEAKKRYILSGQIAGGELRVGLCNYVEEYNRVTKRQKQGLKYHWKQDCDDCTPVTCYPFWEFCSGPITSDNCRYEQTSSPYQCEADYARCTRNKRGVCSWYGKKDYRQCQKQRARDHSENAPFLP